MQLTKKKTGQNGNWEIYHGDAKIGTVCIKYKTPTQPYGVATATVETENGMQTVETKGRSLVTAVKAMEELLKEMNVITAVAKETPVPVSPGAPAMSDLIGQVKSKPSVQ